MPTSMRKHLRGNAHVDNFTKHLFLLHWWDIRKGGGVERGEVRGVANGRSGSWGTTTSLLGPFGVGRSAGCEMPALHLARLGARQPSARVGLTILKGTGAIILLWVPKRLGHVRTGSTGNRVAGPGLVLGQ